MSQNVQIVISNFPEKWLVAPSDIVPLKAVFDQMNKFYFVQIIDFMVQWVTVIINFISAPCKTISSLQLQWQNLQHFGNSHELLRSGVKVCDGGPPLLP